MGDRPSEQVGGFQSEDEAQQWIDRFGRRELPGPVPPGAEVTFDFSVTAPSEDTHFQWRMLQESVAWFGAPSPDVAVHVILAIPGTNAAFVRQSVPATMFDGQIYSVSVTMRNTGTSTWTPGGSNPFRLGSQNPQDNTIWGFGRRELPGPVPPGAEVTFDFSVTAPGESTHFQWRMLQESVAWFGAPSPVVAVIVA